MPILIADSGATKCEWCLIGKRKKPAPLFTQGMSPYFLNAQQVEFILRNELLPQLPDTSVEEVYYYGTGCVNPANVRMIKGVLKKVFPGAYVFVSSDLFGAARALCGTQAGLACILGTGSNSGFYNGSKIAKNSPGLGYVLGDEGSGAYLGKKVLQYYLYRTFDEEMRYRFDQQYGVDAVSILESVYKKPLPNRYLARYALFLSENRGHYMIENIIEDGLNDFFFTHLCKYGESWKYPIGFVGGVAFAFQDILRQLCDNYGFELGRVLQHPIEGLIGYHKG